MQAMNVEIVRQIRVSMPDFPEKLKAARLADGRSVQVLATAAGISSGYWYQIENKERQWVSEEIFRGIERALGIDFGVKFETQEEV